MLTEAQRAEASAASTSSSAISSRTAGRRRSRLSEGLETVPRQVVEYRGHAFRGDGHRRHSPRGIRRSRSSTSSRTPTCPDRRDSSAGRMSHVLLDAGHRRPDDDERAAPGEPERPDLAEHRRPRARDDSRLGAEAGRRGRDGRSHAAGAAQPAGARRRLRAGARRGGATEFLQGIDARRAARARDASGGARRRESSAERGRIVIARCRHRSRAAGRASGCCSSSARIRRVRR